jgi:hypothetical protein
MTCATIRFLRVLLLVKATLWLVKPPALVAKLVLPCTNEIAIN